MGEAGMRRAEFVTIKGGLTQVIRYGELDEADSTESRCLFLIIPGNPGVTEYYDEFMASLYAASSHRIPVWGISHAGHVKTREQKAPSYDELASAPGTAMTLQGQIQHKLAFIQEYIPPDVRIILIGHSIGCYMILHMLEELPPHQVLHCLLLFPTIERMAESPRGKYATPILNWFRWVPIVLAYFMSYTSAELQFTLVNWFLGRDAPRCASLASLHIFDARVTHHATYMAMQEMEQVDRLDEDLITRHQSRLSLYYGADDHWCPQSYYRDLKEKFPHIDAQVCKGGYSHAFVLDASIPMAHKCWTMAEPHIHKLTD